MNSKSNSWKIISWIFGVLFLVMGVLNVFLVHAVPGLIYILISLFYLPPLNSFLKKSIPFLVAPVLKTLIGLVILWGSLAVGDLMEIFEAWYLR